MFFVSAEKLCPFLTSIASKPIAHNVITKLCSELLSESIMQVWAVVGPTVAQLEVYFSSICES